MLEPESLAPVGEPFVIERPGMGRFCCDRTDAGEFIYFTTDTDVLRLRYADGALTLDEGWGGSYAVEGADQSAGWDTCLGSGSLWMMDMGRPPNWGMNRAVAAVAVGPHA